MKTNVIFLLIEYSGIPIALMLYSIIIKELSNSDPIPANDDNESIWLYGIELMVITSVSTLLYGISFFGHADGEGLAKSQLYWVIVAAFISIAEFFILAFLTLKVRRWGKKNRRTRIYPNVMSGFFLIALVFLIIICNDNANNVTDPGTGVDGQVQAGSKNTNVQGWFIIAVSLAVALFIFFLVRHLIWRIKKKAVADYNLGSRVLKNDPQVSIKNLKDSLKKLPDSSPLILDIHMKLAGIFTTLDQSDNALNQIILLENTEAYKSLSSYLKDGIIKMKFQVLIALNKLTEAETLIELFESKQIADRLRLVLLESKKKDQTSR